MYRLLLLLLPRHRRAAYGDEMREVFHHALLAASAKGGRWASMRLWVREVTGMIRFALKDRFGSAGPHGGGLILRDLRWAWRGIRLRGWTAVLSVILMAVAMAASTLVFASADALVFNRVPYSEPERLVGLSQGVTGKAFADFRAQSDILSHVAGRQPGAAFLNTETAPQQVDVEFVTPGLFETLGVLPQWGRPLVDSDRTSIDPTYAVIDAGLAREHFGSPEGAIGQTLDTSERTLTVVGVMPPTFRFPNGRVRIWRALDHERLDRSFGFVGLTARLAPGVSLNDAASALTTRLPHLVRRNQTSIELVPQTFGRSSARREVMLKVLLGAALCLLLAACANVVSLELAGVFERAHTFSIQTALGATRAMLIRVGVIEGALLVSGALATAAGLALIGASGVSSVMPEAVVLGGLNPVDVDHRALLVLGGAAVVMWFTTSLPMVFSASRPDLLGVLKAGARSLASSRAGAWARRGITVVQVALAVTLLVGGLLYMRSYSGLLNVDTGLDTKGVYSLQLTSPTASVDDAGHRELKTRLRDRLRNEPGIQSLATVVGSAPPENAYTTGGTVRLDDGREVGGEIVLRVYDVEPEYFATVGVTLVRGEFFTREDGHNLAVIPDTLARALWNDVDVIGRSFIHSTGTSYTIVGVVKHVRSDLDDLGGPSATAFSIFRQPAAPETSSSGRTASAPPTRTQPAIANAPSGVLPFRFSTLLVRAGTPVTASRILAVAREVDTRAHYRVRPLFDVYAERHAEARMAMSIISSFAVIAFVIAVAGVFGVMTFLVTNRTREIAIRMALGAERTDVRAMVLRSAMRLILIGVTGGAVAAAIAGRWMKSQLFGVTPTDALTYTIVITIVTATALAATWFPARRASRVDPASTLRSE